LLIAREVFEVLQLGFLVVDHTHEDIDKSFGYLSKNLTKQNNYALMDLMNFLWKFLISNLECKVV
jgi:hypothetical protein